MQPFCGEGGYEYNPEDVIALLTAFTGTAAFNINGTMLHAAFQLSMETLSDQKKTTMITSYEKLMQLTIIEVSMTVDEIVVYMSKDKGKYRMGQAYVGLSHVRTFKKTSHHQLHSASN